MHTLRQGLILFTEHYEACVEFYQNTLGLRIWYVKPGLTCFRFGQGYLMIEHGGVASAGEKSRAQSPLVLRLNVADIEAACALLRERGVLDARVNVFPWGRIVHFLDPDGNSIQLCEWPLDAPLRSKLLHTEVALHDGRLACGSRAARPRANRKLLP